MLDRFTKCGGRKFVERHIRGGKNYATTIRDVYCEIRALGKHYIKREIDWITFEDVNDLYKRWINCLTEDQLYIMEKNA
ncbi:hypothetical protein GLOIN_2v1878852 [Rhizophagus irregularis DAOM 181602=DAOM 197198]|nr:hypothetical protein GLOIN_2v1878852 [Rhizophagus irregularis DAOM 181602=DAOM 197198]